MDDDNQTHGLSDRDLLALASVFDVFIDPVGRKVVRVEARYLPGGGRTWAVINEDRFVLNTYGEWEYEQPVISARTEDFLARTRWANVRAALRAAHNAITE